MRKAGWRKVQIIPYDCLGLCLYISKNWNDKPHTNYYLQGGKRLKETKMIAMLL